MTETACNVVNKMPRLLAEMLSRLVSSRLSLSIRGGELGQIDELHKQYLSFIMQAAGKAVQGRFLFCCAVATSPEARRLVPREY
jgi:hypothetical protein